MVRHARPMCRSNRGRRPCPTTGPGGRTISAPRRLQADVWTRFFQCPGFEIVDVPDLKSIFILDIAGPHSWRVIYMDGRPHPTGDDLRPTFLGHSVGHWEGDTLVVDTVGFNEKQWVAGVLSHHRTTPHDRDGFHGLISRHFPMK